MHFWSDYPIITLPLHVKLYYLIQAAFWIQQLIRLAFFTPAEERRKDHGQMITHHIITTILVVASYSVHFTHVGNAVLVVMDAADVFLCLAKCIKYLGPKYQVSIFMVYTLLFLTELINFFQFNYILLHFV